MKRVLLFAALLVWAGMASAVVYKWTDAQGKVQYGDRPPDGVHAEVVALLGNHSPRAPSPGSSGTAPVNPQPPKAAPANAKPEDAAAKQAIDADVAQTRDKQCADAQERYKKLIEGRKIYKAGADGERQYLTSEEIDSERINAKREIDTVCNSPT